MVRRKYVIVTVAIMAAVGVLLGRDYPKAGYIVTIIPMIAYLVLSASGGIKALREFSNTDNRTKAKAIVWIIFLILVITSVAMSEVRNFMLLILLAADYLLYDNKK